LGYRVAAPERADARVEQASNQKADGTQPGRRRGMPHDVCPVQRESGEDRAGPPHNEVDGRSATEDRGETLFGDPLDEVREAVPAKTPAAKLSNAVGSICASPLILIAAVFHSGGSSGTRGGRGDGLAVWEQLAAVVKQHHSVAQQAPPLLGTAGNGPGGSAIWR
jgi:hypothetical protein